MKRLVYLTPLLAMLVLVFASLAVAQSSTDQTTQSGDLNLNVGSPTDPTQSSDPNQTSDPTQSSDPTPTTQTVTIQNHAFNPPQLTVAPGTTVTWVNNDPVAHTVTADDGTSFDSGALQPGQSFSHTFQTEGTFTYHCTIHPDMTGSVVVGGGSGGGSTTTGAPASDPTQTAGTPAQTASGTTNVPGSTDTNGQLTSG